MTRDEASARLDALLLGATFEVGRLWHVGTGDPADKSGSSYEGDGLSVSRHPEEWTRIAKLGGSSTWEVARRDGSPTTMVDAHEVPSVPLMEAAHALGWVEPVVVWTATLEDEDGDAITFDCATREEAIDEVAEGLDLDPDDPDDLAEIEGRVERADAWTPATDIMPSLTDGKGMSAHELVLVHALTVRPALSDVDGVWWEDTFDPDALSAPRGTVLADRVGRFDLAPHPGPEEEMGFEEWTEDGPGPAPSAPSP